MSKIYCSSNLRGFDYLNEKIASPVSHSLSGWAIRKIEYLTEKAYLRMNSVLAISLSHVLAAAMPIFALLDTFSNPFKLLFRIATLDKKGLKEELLNTAKHISLLFFSVPYAISSLAKPGSIYHCEKTWKLMKAAQFAKDLLENEEKARKKKEELGKKSFTLSLHKTLSTILSSEKSRKRLEKLIEAVANAVKYETKEAAVQFEYITEWFSKFILECQVQDLALDKIDSSFFDLMTALTQLRMPTLRKRMTKGIVSDYNKKNALGKTFDRYIKKIHQEREKKIFCYLEDLKKKKGKIPSPSKEALESKFPSYRSSHFSFLPLYFFLKILKPEEEEKFQEAFSFVKNKKFKEAANYQHLMTFLLLLEPVEPALSNAALKEVGAFLKEDDKNLFGTLAAIKNINILLKLKEKQKLFSLLKDSHTSQKLKSHTFVAELFKEMFSLKKYQEEKGMEALAKDFESTFGKFRDPLAIMTYFSTLSLLGQKTKLPAIKSLTEYVEFTLEGGSILKQKRHDVTRSLHLKKMYKKYPFLKEAWEKTKMLKAVDLDPSIAGKGLKGYVVGETEEPCDLLMQTTEVSKSCMHIAGRANKARGLLGHMLDGKTHPVVIKNERGKIVARVLMRLLDCKEKNSPVLALDTLYTATTTEEKKKIYQHLIKSYCKQKAQEMNIQLLTMFSNGKPNYGKVSSYGGVGAFEHLNPIEGHRLKNVDEDCMTFGTYTLPASYPI